MAKNFYAWDRACVLVRVCTYSSTFFQFLPQYLRASKNQTCSSWDQRPFFYGSYLATFFSDWVFSKGEFWWDEELLWSRSKSFALFPFRVRFFKILYKRRIVFGNFISSNRIKILFKNFLLRAIKSEDSMNAPFKISKGGEIRRKLERKFNFAYIEDYEEVASF